MRLWGTPVSKTSAGAFVGALLGAVIGNAIFLSGGTTNSYNNHNAPERTIYEPPSAGSAASAEHNMRPGAHLVSSSKSQPNSDLEQARKKLGEIIRAGGSKEQIEQATKKLIETQAAQSSAEYRKRAQELRRNNVADTDILEEVARSSKPSSEELANLPRNNTVSDPTQIYTRLLSSAWIEEGTGSKVLYVFFDVRCPACQKAHNYFEPLIKQYDLQIRYVPVGALGAESLELASIAMSGPNNEQRLKLLKTLMSTPSTLSKSYSHIPQSKIKAARQHALSNFNILISTGKPATPTFAYLTESGPKLSVVRSRGDLERIAKQIVASSE